MPLSVSVPAPILISPPPVPPPAPPSSIVPLTVVEVLLPPTVKTFWPSWKRPAPAMAPAVIRWSKAGPDVPEKSTQPPASVTSEALPAVLQPQNSV
ncbi:hypothetical protein D3C86_1776310 [compost metagenome]